MSGIPPYPSERIGEVGKPGLIKLSNGDTLKFGAQIKIGTAILEVTGIVTHDSRLNLGNPDPESHRLAEEDRRFALVCVKAGRIAVKSSDGEANTIDLKAGQAVDSGTIGNRAIIDALEPPYPSERIGEVGKPGLIKLSNGDTLKFGAQIKIGTAILEVTGIVTHDSRLNLGNPDPESHRLAEEDRRFALVCVKAGRIAVKSSDGEANTIDLKAGQAVDSGTIGNRAIIDALGNQIVQNYNSQYIKIDFKLAA